MRDEDIAIVERIERAYREHAYTPVVGEFIGEYENQRCGLGALLTADECRMLAKARFEQYVAGLLDRSEKWVTGFYNGFDDYDLPLTATEDQCFATYGQSWRDGYEAGRECASRVFRRLETSGR